MTTTTTYNISETMNSTVNFTGFPWAAEDPVYVIVRRTQTVLLPIIIVVGIIGNSLAVGSFLSKSLRKTSCCLYLGAKSVSDIGFLVSLFIFFLLRVHVTLLNHQGVCQVTVFLIYFCPFLSIWLVVVITFENCIRISQPALVSTICTTAVAKRVIVGYVVVGLVVYNFPFWTTRIVNGQCASATELEHIQRAFTYMDTFLTLVFPLIIMLILVPLVAISALSAFKRKKRLVQGQKRVKKNKKAAASPEAQVTRMLFAVSVVFFVLHTPSHAIRIKEMIIYMSYSKMPTYQDQIMQRIFELIYYLDFCVSLVVYLIFGRNFRKVFVKQYFQRCRGKSQSMPFVQNCSSSCADSEIFTKKARQ
ncbi:FMRFamide receptor-like [Gigantopelta aegis]|uniref:FMRFamide receptor-like n=1 Tax=Gigantopelta aegis TaxID=1735272 RepID=UPI001B887A57|nr:FMRFamide receptor-like [Gigantopelta aegis]